MHHENVNALLSQTIYKGNEQPTYMDMTKSLTTTVSGRKVVEKKVSMIQDDFDFSDDEATVSATIEPARRSVLPTSSDDMFDVEELEINNNIIMLQTQTKDNSPIVLRNSNNGQTVTTASSLTSPQPLASTSNRKIQKKQKNISPNTSNPALQNEGMMLPPTPRPNTVKINIASHASKNEKMIAILNRHKQSTSILTENVQVDNSTNVFDTYVKDVTVDEGLVEKDEEEDEDDEETKDDAEEETKLKLGK